MLNRIQHSLSTKLIILFLCAGAVLLLLVGSIMGKGFSRHFRSSIQPFMVHYVELMQQELGSPPDLTKAKRITRDIPVDIHVFGPELNWSTASAPLDRSQLTESLDNLTNQFESELTRTQKRFRLKRIDDGLILLTRDGDYDVYFQIHHDGDIRHGGQFSWFILFSILIVLSLIYYATRSLFRPIEDIDHGVGQFGIGNLSYRISKYRNDQLGDLTDSVNQMAEDISNLLEAKRQFLLGISHELRSPLTRGKINLALMEDSIEKSELNKDIKLMDQLINELLESERLNSPHKVIQSEITDLQTLIEEVVESEFGDQNISTLLQPVTADVDPARIKLLVRNLLQNAIKSTKNDNHKPRISLEADTRTQKFTITVEDFGKGIAKEHIPFLTEPFYRADPSRQRITGGYGLGLYLCRMIVEAHFGQLRIKSELGKGAQIQCRFPLAAKSL